MTTIEIELIEEKFGVYGLTRNCNQIIIHEDYFDQVQVQSFPYRVEEDLLYFINEFVNEVISDLREHYLFFIVMDNVSMIDKASWRLFDLVSLFPISKFISKCNLSFTSLDNIGQ